MTTLGWLYHSCQHSSGTGQSTCADRRFIGLFGSAIVHLDTLAAVRHFLAFYRCNAQLHDFEHSGFCLCQHILALMGLLPPRYLWPFHQLVDPSSDEVTALWPICPEVSPCHLVCG